MKDVRELEIQLYTRPVSAISTWRYDPIAQSGLSIPELLQIAEYRKSLLIQFLGDPSIDPNEIELGGGHELEDFTYNGRFYHVYDLNHWNFGDSYHNMVYKDIDNHRCAYKMYMVSPAFSKNVKPLWSLYVGSECVYTWKNRPRHYQQKTVKQLDILADSFINEMVKHKENIDFDLDIARETIRYHFEQLYLRHDFEYKNKSLRSKRRKEINEYRHNSPYYSGY